MTPEPCKIYLEKPQNKLDPPDRNHSPLVDVDNVPGDLEVPDISIGEQSVLLVGVEQAEVLHDDGDKQVEDDVGDDDVEAAEEHDGGHKVAAVWPKRKIELLKQDSLTLKHIH